MMRLVTFLLLLSSLPAIGTKAAEPSDFQSVMNWCDSIGAQPIEGIWVFTDDRVEVAICRSPGKALRHYTVTVLTDYSGQLLPGAIIGEITGGSDPSKYKLTLKEKKKGLLKSCQIDCLLTLGKLNDSLRVERPKKKIRVNLLSMLPHFRRLLYISKENPADNFPIGLLKIYPSYDGNGSSTITPRYL